MRNSVIYTVHAAIVTATAYLASITQIANWYYVILIGLPLLLASFRKLSALSYTINARILLPISVGFFFVTLFHYFPELMSGSSNELARYGISNQESGIEQEFFQVNPIFKDAVSVLYAICAAFLLWKGLSDFDELKHVLYEEANEIRSISDYCTYFVAGKNGAANEAPVRRLREFLLIYLQNMLAGNKIVANSENENVLEQCLLTVGELKATDENDPIALEEIMKGLSRVTILRSKRTVCIEKRMSPFILGLMFLMSLTMVSAFFGKANGQFNIDYIYVFLLPAFYTSIFMTLLDLSSPFDGYWSIKLEAIKGVSARIQSKLDPETLTIHLQR